MLAVAFGAAAAEPVSMTLADGTAVTGEIIKFDDNGLMLHLTGEAYATTNIAWSRLSQDSLKHLVANPKLKPLAEPFIEPDASQRPAKPEIKVNEVHRLDRPANPSLLGGLFGSPLGLFLLLVVYGANLYAAYEVSVIRARPAIQVIGLSAVLPIAGPAIFLAMPIKIEAPKEVLEFAAPAGTAGAAAARTPEDIQVVEASWKKDEKKPEPQIFARGKFTFNKRFIETKFVGYFGTPRGDALKFTMELKTSTAQHTVERIMQVAVTEVILETKTGQVTVPLADIQEIRLVPVPEPPAA
jgi:ribosome maturation factor RimP